MSLDVKTLDETRLAAWLEKNLDGFKGPLKATKFVDGQSNSTLLIEAASGSYVLRRNPPGVLLQSAHSGYGYLIPSQPRANLLKVALVVYAGHIYYFLGVASAKRETIEENLVRIEKRKNRGRALILLLQAPLSPTVIEPCNRNGGKQKPGIIM